MDIHWRFYSLICVQYIQGLQHSHLCIVSILLVHMNNLLFAQRLKERQ